MLTSRRARGFGRPTTLSMIRPPPTRAESDHGEAEAAGAKATDKPNTRAAARSMVNVPSPPSNVPDCWPVAIGEHAPEHVRRDHAPAHLSGVTPCEALSP